MASLPCCDFFRTDCKAGAYRGLGKCSIGCLIHEVRKYLKPTRPGQTDNAAHYVEYAREYLKDFS